MKDFFQDLLTDSSGDYSSRLVSGWIAFITMLVIIIVGVCIGKDVGEVVTPLFVYIGGCFGLSVFGELRRDKNSSKINSKPVEEEISK